MSEDFLIKEVINVVKNNNSKKKMSPLTAGAIGAGIGALAGAAAVALSDEKTRKKLGQGLKKIEKTVQDATLQAEKKAQLMVSDAKAALKKKKKK